MRERSLISEQFLNEHCGTHRTASGSLLETAGRALPLDKLAYQFFSAPQVDRAGILARAREVVANLTAPASTTGAYYVKAMERVLEKGEDWIKKETAR